MWWVFTVDCCVNLMRSPGWDAAVVQQQQRGWARLESPPPRPPPSQPSSIPTKPRSPATAATRPTHGQHSSPPFLEACCILCEGVKDISRNTISNITFTMYCLCFIFVETKFLP